MMDLLCKLDLLMRAPSRKEEQLISVPALLSSDTGVRWPNRKGESERVVRTEFADVFSPGMTGLVIAHLPRTVGDERASAELIRSVAIMLLVRGEANTGEGKRFRVV